MRCVRVDSLIDVYVDGRLTPRDAAKLEAHLLSCARCSRRAEAARALAKSLALEPKAKAPEGFLDAVMARVYREALWSPSGAETPARSAPEGAFAPAWAGRARPSVVPAVIYRRLGLSFVLSAAVLAASLLIPSIAYPSLIRADMGLSSAGVSMEKVIDGVGLAARGTIRPSGISESEHNGGISR
jgi:anti-sigma factor RsiW